MPWYLTVIISIIVGIVGFFIGLLSVQSKYERLYEPCGKIFVTVDKRGVEHYDMHVDNLDTLINRKYALFIMSVPSDKKTKYIPYEELVEELNHDEKT